MSVLEFVIALIGSVGGLELIKYLLNLRNNKRTKEIETDMKQFKAYQEQNAYWQKEVAKCNERYDEQTKRLRMEQDAHNATKEELTKLKVEFAVKRCEVQKCANRKPPTGY